MVRVLRLIGGTVVWTVAACGLVAGVFWLTTAVGFVQPLIVISGSMEPEIDTGDLLFARRVPTADVQVGDVVSLPSELVENLVTHRVVSIEPLGDGTWAIEMQGDANPSPDSDVYIVGDEVWKPAMRIPGMGTTVTTLTQREVVIPAAVALLAFFGFALLDDEDDEEDEDDDREGAGDGDGDQDHKAADASEGDEPNRADVEPAAENPGGAADASCDAAGAWRATTTREPAATGVEVSAS